jgi:hypothetical protein
MKRFITRLALFSLFPLAACVAVLGQLDGYTDAFYLRFTTAAKDSLIIGTSRAAQGLQPAVMNSVLQRSDVFNYAFTNDHSPFGKTYFDSIKRKINSNSRNGIQVVTVDPWSISSNTLDPNDDSSFPERELALGKTKIVNMKPNIFYLIQSYEAPLKSLLNINRNSGEFLHDDGWLEVTVPMDSDAVSERSNRRILDYRTNYLPNYKFSEVRWKYLLKTIEFLEDHGDVYLVRMPVPESMLEIEKELMRDFDDRIATLGRPYRNFTTVPDDYQYIDGNHLFKGSGEKVSRDVAEWIKTGNQQAR